MTDEQSFKNGERLSKEAEALRETAADLDRTVKQMIAREVPKVAVTKARFRTMLAVSGVLLVALVLTGLFSYRAAQQDFTTAVTTCFLRPGDKPPAITKACAERFGAEYTDLQKRSAAATSQFVDLQRWAKSKGWTPPPAPKR